jgi:sterol desaturase/sphingolipid hydroxylase (fatty acid hydroxylase superfamily)
MHKLIDTITSIPVNYIVIALILLFYTLEQLLSTPFAFTKRSDHFFNNFSFQVIITGITFLFAMLQVYCINYINQHHWGLFNRVNISFPVKVILGIAAFDLMSYWFHRLSHKLPPLWKLHRVHHSDTTMDCSTFFRHHPLEIFVSGVSAILAAAIFGLDLKTLEVFLVITISFMIVQHANISFPHWVDVIFGKIFITPTLHKVHHSQAREYTDSNYADIFVFWDVLFGTYKYLPLQKIKYGLPEFDEEKKQSFWYLLKSPFIKNKIFGEKPEGLS